MLFKDVRPKENPKGVRVVRSHSAVLVHLEDQIARDKEEAEMKTERMWPVGWEDHVAVFWRVECSPVQGSGRCFKDRGVTTTRYCQILD